MKNGLYSAKFGTPLGQGAGVLYMQDGVFRGGDGALYYVGNYSINGNEVSATLETGRHCEGTDSVFGTDKVHVQLDGSADGDSAHLTGSFSGVSFTVNLARICG